MSMPSSDERTPTFSPSRAASATSAAWRRAFVGMHPRCKQVPPTLSRSTKITERPSSAARSAHAYPPLPAPRMTRSAVREADEAATDEHLAGGDGIVCHHSHTATGCSLEAGEAADLSVLVSVGLTLRLRRRHVRRRDVGVTGLGRGRTLGRSRLRVARLSVVGSVGLVGLVLAAVA